jgi:hypothetical protein
MRATEISQSTWAMHCSQRTHRAVVCCCVPVGTQTMSCRKAHTTQVAAGVTLICYNACHGMSFRWQRMFRPHSNPRYRGIKWTSFGVCCWCFASACVVSGRRWLLANPQEVEAHKRGLREHRVHMVVYTLLRSAPLKTRHLWRARPLRKRRRHTLALLTYFETPTTPTGRTEASPPRRTLGGQVTGSTGIHSTAGRGPSNSGAPIPSRCTRPLRPTWRLQALP